MAARRTVQLLLCASNSLRRTPSYTYVIICYITEDNFEAHTGHKDTPKTETLLSISITPLGKAVMIQ